MDRKPYEPPTVSEPQEITREALELFDERQLEQVANSDHPLAPVARELLDKINAPL